MARFPFVQFESLRSIMVQPEKQNATFAATHFESSLLRAIVTASSEFWVFLDAGEMLIRCCSHRFLSLWGIPAEVAGTGVDALNSDSMADATAFSPWNRDLPAFGKCMERIRAVVTCREVMIDDDLCHISWQVVFDDSGLPMGSLVFLRLRSEVERTFATLSGARSADALKALSPREREVVHRLYHGATNRAISLQCRISQKTVEKHRAAAMKKLKVASFSQLIRTLTLAEVTHGADWSGRENSGAGNLTQK